MQSIPVWENVSKEQFHNEIVPLNKPAVIKSLMADWSIVKAAKKSPIDFAKYIKSRDNKTQVAALVGVLIAMEDCFIIKTLMALILLVSQ